MTCHEGGCLCGHVRFRVSAPPLEAGYCHCRLCQRNSGAPVVAWVTFPIGGFSWTSGEPKTYASSAHAERSFCGTCGSYLVFVSGESPNEVSINTTALDDPDAFPPQKHIFVESRVSWFDTADSLPRFEGYPDEAV